MLRVLYFAAVRDRVGLDEEEVPFRSGMTASQLIQELENRHPALSGLKTALRIAVNQEFSSLNQLLRDNDEVALIPPVSGG